ncbi:MAG: hypothetical protein AAFX40_13390 [Cyanobacteria bacterium J06639_1]
MERNGRLAILLLDYAQLVLSGGKSEQLVRWAAQGDWTRKSGVPSAGDRAFALALALFLNPDTESSRDRRFVPYIAKDLAGALVPARRESVRRVAISARVTARGFTKPAEKVGGEDFARIRIRARSLVRHVGDSGVFEGFPMHRCYATIDRLEDEYASRNRPSEAYFAYLDCILHVFLEALCLDLNLITLSDADYRILEPYLQIALQIARSLPLTTTSEVGLREQIEARMVRPRITNC